MNDGFNTVNAQVSVTVNALPPQPVITAGGSTSFCAGSSVTLTSSAGTTYLWSTGATTPGINVNTSGSFTVRVTNASGCQSIASEAVTTVVNALPSAPIVGVITPPTCSLATGSVLLMGLPSTGNWTLTRYPGTIASEGSGASYHRRVVSTPAYTIILLPTHQGVHPPCQRMSIYLHNRQPREHQWLALSLSLLILCQPEALISAGCRCQVPGP